ncbi:class III extradiol dioxygenase subunit B-like domain-containing protein [Rhodococcus sp. SGAir0479]|uniref:class III extradiol dioxygenase subunit B-like domain-containing protein n=1 Tax=Rhodococcus sp. SGAir0479 TaxID=2567884 RepID=UPI0010CD5CFD|nr:class III extradiol dioxygenase subunit B-like domain-containing protein [Rhodococcus sp. SGAir0479]QCQ90785.1 hypothetical protein E7742_05700 [Rhodococcus sp. SGAir0479]
MLTAAAFVPSPPLLVPELTGAAASETDQLRRAALDVASRLGRVSTEWTVLAVADPDAPSAGEVAPEKCGSFAGFGVDVRVSLSPDASGRDTDRSMPLPALVAGWLRGAAAPDARVRVRLLAPETTSDDCVRLGRELRAELDARPEPQALLVVADGANTLTDKAPGAFDERSPHIQSGLDAALADGDCDALGRLDPGTCREIGLAGRAAWQTFAAVFSGPAGGPRKSESLYAGAPYGVGYHVGMWLP